MRRARFTTGLSRERCYSNLKQRIPELKNEAGISPEDISEEPEWEYRGLRGICEEELQFIIESGLPNWNPAHDFGFFKHSRISASVIASCEYAMEDYCTNVVLVVKIRKGKETQDGNSYKASAYYAPSLYHKRVI